MNRQSPSLPQTARLSRRRVISGAPVSVGALLGLGSLVAQTSAAQTSAAKPATDAADGFPKTHFQRVYNTVLKAHSDAEAVKALVEHTPSLSNAAMDWAFGDWETAIGAAAHMGRADIAEILLKNGARPDIFAHAMLGHTQAVEAAVTAMPGIQSTLGPHGLTLLFHAKAGGDVAEGTVAFLEKLGDADPKHTDQPGAEPFARYIGKYRHAPGEYGIIEIAERRGRLTLKAGESFPQGLFHLGDHTFHPNGVPSINVRFQMIKDKAATLIIADAATLVEGARI